MRSHESRIKPATMTRSQMMARVRNRDTAPELAVRKVLWASGVRYRLHDRRYSGHPDIFVPRLRLAIFVHGCFWHGHNCKRGTPPKTNRRFWRKKLRINSLRDIRVRSGLAKDKIHCLTLWTCRPNANAIAIARVVQRYHASRPKCEGYS
jgi:DNA mismatch endonuclease (patch repair protein)